MKPGARPPGQLRQSQVITTFGPGAMLDLPNHSVLIGGLDSWTGKGEEIHEPRLTAKLQLLIELPSLKLFSPPPDQEDASAPQTGISVWQFPEWFITQDIASTGSTTSPLGIATARALGLDLTRRKRAANRAVSRKETSKWGCSFTLHLSLNELLDILNASLPRESCSRLFDRIGRLLPPVSRSLVTDGLLSS